MTNEKIETLRNKLNNLIATNASYDEIYKVSKQIDECIVECYRNHAKAQSK